MRGQFVLLYRELIKLGITPLDVDRMSMWQIGAMFDDEETPAVRPYSAGGMDPNMRARIEQAKRGEGIALIPVPAKGLLSDAKPKPQPQVEVSSDRV